MTLKQSRATGWTLERLERRDVPAATLVASMFDGVLYVEGTEDADSITVVQTGGSAGTVSVVGVEIHYEDEELPRTSVPTAELTRIAVWGLGGNDLIDLRQVRIPTLAFGGDGNDRLQGSPVNDILQGGPGNDILIGGDGDDQLFGQDGNDALAGGLGNDFLIGGDGNDRMWGQDGNDRLWGQGGNDQLLGHDGNDDLIGGAGHDELFGGNGNDRLWGQAGNDWLFGQGGNDYLDGGSGINVGWGGGEADLFVGFGQSLFWGPGFRSPYSGVTVYRSGILDYVRAQGDRR